MSDWRLCTLSESYIIYLRQWTGELKIMAAHAQYVVKPKISKSAPSAPAKSGVHLSNTRDKQKILIW